MCYVEGGICIVAVDYLAVPVSGTQHQIGTIPSWLKPLGHTGATETGSDDTAYIAPLGHRGDISKAGQLIVTNSGKITVWVNSEESGAGYYYGNLVFPVTSS